MARCAGVRPQRLDVPLVQEVRVPGNEVIRTHSTGFFSFQAFRTLAISVLLALSLPLTTRWQPMQVCIDGMPGSGETATE